MSDPIVIVHNFIDGQFTDGEQAYIDSFDPSTGSVWAKIPDSGASEVDRAVKAAVTAQKQWASTPVLKRVALIHKIADLLEKRLEEFAQAESRDQGKPVWLARAVDIPRAVHNFRSFASSLNHHLEKSNYMDTANAINYTTRSPVGVAALISPWNLPLYLLTFKIAPAIALGNTVVCKPSEFTSVTAWMLCKVLQDAELPPGVINMVFGTGAKVGHSLTVHPDTQLISFTGSGPTAERIKATAAPFCKKLSLELGGKNAAVIFADTNLDKCIQTTIRSSFLNQGEICLCTSRIFVQRPIFQEFVTKFVEAMRKLKIGDPKEDSSWMGALISKEHLEKVKGYATLAKDEGHTIFTAEEPLALPSANQNGYFFPPTCIVDVPDSSRLMQEEIFGPITCVVPFDKEAEVIERANNVQYGLCATVWSSDVNTIHRVSKQLQVGTVWANCWLVRDLNMPFGGVKSSGIGREGLQESLDFFTEVKTVCLQLD